MTFVKLFALYQMRLRTRLLKKAVATPRTMRTTTWMTWMVGFGLLKIEDGRLVAALCLDG
ncbi:hypothetical protein BDA96_08G080800 [Sorghum bicolor]|uniref:Uncharacterized protein n=2 Tax=Sorghum bicolor TaxID=4558 RepID=A0A921QET6_SORBI|nr:hypothetical protein BDA96_08G080800 [Sorghum bicolor]OQU78941.1 hypothetical protein SORBI_3008G075566 [Sorghum bicolor]